MHVLFQEWRIKGRQRIYSISKSMEQLREAIRQIEGGGNGSVHVGLPYEARIHNDCRIADLVRKATTFIDDEDRKLLRLPYHVLRTLFPHP